MKIHLVAAALAAAACMVGCQTVDPDVERASNLLYHNPGRSDVKSNETIEQRNARLAEAEELFQRAIGKNPGDAFLYNNLGLTYAKLDRFDDAIANYNEAIKLKSDYAVAFNNRGAAIEKKGDIEGAMADYKRAIDADSDYAFPHYNMSLVYFQKLNDDVAALKSIDEAIKDDGGRPHYHYQRGEILNKMCNKKAALKAYQRAVELEPDYANAKARVAEVEAYIAAHPEEEHAKPME